jgi:hypothetical protein
MHHQAGRFIDNGQVLVFEDYAEWDGVRLEGPGGLRLGKVDADRIAPGEDAGGTGDLAADADPLVGYEAGGLGPGEAQLITEETIQPLSLRAQNRKCDF